MKQNEERGWRSAAQNHVSPYLQMVTSPRHHFSQPSSFLESLHDSIPSLILSDLPSLHLFLESLFQLTRKQTKCQLDEYQHTVQVHGALEESNLDVINLMLSLYIAHGFSPPPLRWFPLSSRLLNNNVVFFGLCVGVMYEDEIDSSLHFWFAKFSQKIIGCPRIRKRKHSHCSSQNLGVFN